MSDGLPALQPLPVLRPLPQRNFQITPASTEPPTPPSDTNESHDRSSFDSKSNGGEAPPSRTRSILNLTSSTLFGIYAPTESERGGGDGINTPWGTGAMTPIGPRTPNIGMTDAKKPPTIGVFERRPLQAVPLYHHTSLSGAVLSITVRTTLLFAFGMAYGMIVTHLHDEQKLSPIKVENIDRYSWRYLMFWGMAGVALGTLLPYIDIFWKDMWGEKHRSDADIIKEQVTKSKETADDDEIEKAETSRGSSLGADWNPVVRSVGAFIGIAFAIRKLPWQSTLQVSLTLALVNPVLWYIIDRSQSGFVLSAVVGIAGTAVLTAVNPGMVPSPALSPPQGTNLSDSYSDLKSDRFITHEAIGVWTWIASVLFCSCVCFGNIGRRLALAWPRTGVGKSVS